jgi:tetratricopeptide (TPR) repeat protein
MLGLSLEALNDLSGAYEAYNQAINHWVSVGDNANTLDARAGLARCLLAQNDSEAALSQIKQSLTWLDEYSLTGLDHPFRFYLTAYQVLQAANQDSEAPKILAEAHTLLQTRAAKIADNELRRSFLENVSQNQAIVAEWAKIAV